MDGFISGDSNNLVILYTTIYTSISTSACYNLNMDSQTRSIAKTAKKVKLTKQKSDFGFWQTQSYQKRLAALEQIRQEYATWKYGSRPRFQRVLSIIKRK
jgi:hypothetical protein